MKKHGMMLAAAAAVMLMAAGCGASAETETTAAAAETEAAAETTKAEETAEAAETQEAETEGQEAASGAAEEEAGEAHYLDDTVLRVGSLKGPTTMGLVNMMALSEAGELPYQAEFTMATTADEITAKIASGDMDIALIPANLASVLYNKTEGQIAVLDINTLGVLYGVTGDPSIKGLSDLAGKTVYMTGQGTTPEFALDYILAENGLSEEVTVEFKNEATEIAALLQEDPMAIAILPQPFATVTQQQNSEVKEFLDLTEEWKSCPDSGSSELVTGVTIVRKEFLEAHEALVAEFVLEHQESALKAQEDPEQTSQLVAQYGIIEKAPVAKLALPKCNIVCITGNEMQEALSGYLEVLYQANPQSVGGALPAEDFYAFTEVSGEE